MRDCKHGQLARSCEICALESERDALKEKIVRLSGKTGFCASCESYAKEIDRLKAELDDFTSSQYRLVREIEKERDFFKSCTEAMAEALEDICMSSAPFRTFDGTSSHNHMVAIKLRAKEALAVYRSATKKEKQP